MSNTVIFLLDLVALVTAFAAAWLWFRASQNQQRRVKREEEIDAADLNRIIVALNRSQILNGRAAIATGLSALAVALRLLYGLVFRS